MMFLIPWSARKNCFITKQKIDQLCIAELVFQSLNLERRPKNLWIRGHQCQESRPTEDWIKAKHYERSKVNVVLRYWFKQKMLFEVYFYEVSRWESHWGNTAEKRYKETLTFLRPPFTYLVSQALLVESQDMFWIIFEGRVMFPQMLFHSSHSLCKQF